MLRINPLDERETRELETLQSTLSREMESSKNRLETFLSTSLLPPRVLHRLVLLKRDILIEEQQLALYITELQHCVRPNPHSRVFYFLFFYLFIFLFIHLFFIFLFIFYFLNFSFFLSLFVFFLSFCFPKSLC